MSIAQTINLNTFIVSSPYDTIITKNNYNVKKQNKNNELIISKQKPEKT